MNRPAWQREGIEPDYRFSLANERTFLAWMRTALSLLAAAVFLAQFADRLSPRLGVLAIAIGLMILAAMLSLTGYTRWRANQIAMRHARPLPPTGVLAVTALAMATLAVATFGLLWMRA